MSRVDIYEHPLDLSVYGHSERGGQARSSVHYRLLPTNSGSVPRCGGSRPEAGAVPLSDHIIGASASDAHLLFLKETKNVSKMSRELVAIHMMNLIGTQNLIQAIRAG